MKRSLHKCSLTFRHIGHTRTNNGFFKLVEALLQTHSWFFSQSTNVRGLVGLSLSACHCRAALPAKICAFNSVMQGCQISFVAYGQNPDKKWLFFKKVMAKITKCFNYGNFHIHRCLKLFGRQYRPIFCR